MSAAGTNPAFSCNCKASTGPEAARNAACQRRTDPAAPDRAFHPRLPHFRLEIAVKHLGADPPGESLPERGLLEDGPCVDHRENLAVSAAFLVLLCPEDF